jgi:hypothetical protein
MTKDKALRLALEALEKLWNIIDDIDTYSDMAKADEKLYRSLVERRQRQRFEETGISTDGYELHGGAIKAIKAALEAKNEPVAWKWHQAPVKTQWGHEMVVADLAIDKDHTASIYCERNQKTRVEVMLTTPPQRTWVGLTGEEKIIMSRYDLEYAALIGEVERKLKEKNNG